MTLDDLRRIFPGADDAALRRAQLAGATRPGLTPAESITIAQQQGVDSPGAVESIINAGTGLATQASSSIAWGSAAVIAIAVVLALFVIAYLASPVIAALK